MSPSDFPKEASVSDLRARLVELRRELGQTTDACRTALARRSSGQLRQLLRSKSQLMRQVLEAQSQLLLAIREESCLSRRGPDTTLEDRENEPMLVAR
jgi:hypothetical protein